MMRSGSCSICAILLTGIALAAAPSYLHSQEPASGQMATVAQPLPDAPQPQFEVASADAQQTPPPQNQSTPQPAPNSATPPTPTPQDSSSSQSAAPQADAEKTKHEKAEEQIKEQEKQRVLGILPSFNISYRADAVPLTAGEKMKLAFRTSVDPVAFAVATVVAGYHEVNDDDPGFGWGAEGFGKRAGAAYLDAFDGTMIGNGILPALLHQDPRYFRLGHGTPTHRILYALFTNIACKGDKSRKWQPNISNVGGNIVSGYISNYYYPSQDSGIGETLSNGFIVTAEGGFGSLFQEFWPDVSRKFLHKDPTQGRDAQARAQDAAEKQARKEAREKGKQSQIPSQPENPAPK
jgi:hypothetical protein